MISFCCCQFGEESEEHAYPSSSIHRNYLFLRYTFPWLFTGYAVLSQWFESRTQPSLVPGETPLTSSGLNATFGDNSLSDTSQLVPRPPAFNDPRYSHIMREGLCLRREKSLGLFHQNSQVIRSDSVSGIEALGADEKHSSMDIAEDKAGRSESKKTLFAKTSYGVEYVPTFPEDEDVCPTCLEEYTAENPKIVALCSHHFHLGCIYEWMERSDFCPLCGKEMVLCESP